MIAVRSPCQDTTDQTAYRRRALWQNEDSVQVRVGRERLVHLTERVRLLASASQLAFRGWLSEVVNGEKFEILLLMAVRRNAVPDSDDLP